MVSVVVLGLTTVKVCILRVREDLIWLVQVFCRVYTMENGMTPRQVVFHDIVQLRITPISTVAVQLITQLAVQLLSSVTQDMKVTILWVCIVIITNHGHPYFQHVLPWSAQNLFKTQTFCWQFQVQQNSPENHFGHLVRSDMKLYLEMSVGNVFQVANGQEMILLAKERLAPH